ncbi:hypothetical protein E0H46_31920 [Rhizobium leguminosarum bv. viciae]|nr:hypothetical protein E0H46_31920 [Rhizobium leguminosarum bv. viciae]
MKKQESYWSFKATDTPEFSDLPAGTFAGTEAGWNSLSPGYRRAIWREATKTIAKEQPAISEDEMRLQRADEIHSRSEVQIAAREAL